MPIRTPLRRIILSVVAVMFLSVGCSKDGKTPKTSSRKGTVKSIDLANRKVTMVFLNKRGEDKPLEGTFTDETVVTVNGRNMSMKDVRVGDKVEVVGRKEGKGTSAYFVATKVNVERFDGDWQDTGKAGGKKPADTETAKADGEG